METLTKSKVDVSHLHSSSSLGLHERLAGRKSRGPGQSLREEDAGLDEDDRTSEPSSSSIKDGIAVSSDPPNHQISTTENTSQAHRNIVFGSGLKRLPQSTGDSTASTRKRQKFAASFMWQTDLSEDSWDGFDDSEHSALVSKSSLFGDDKNGEQTQDSSMDVESSADLSVHSEEDRDEKEERKQRSLAFKDWATQQVNEVTGYASLVPTETSHQIKTNPDKEKPISRFLEVDSLSPELVTTSHDIDRKSHHVQVERSESIQELRSKLPVVAEEQKIMEAVFNNPVTVIWGATGSGKTTQIPQFLYEAGFGNKAGPDRGMIGVTQPRRVAAVSMSQRIAQELGDTGDKVAFQVRFNSSTGPKTIIKFMTDGILVREIANDFSLSKYSVIVIDEAHERSSNTDILIGMISRIVDMREDMSKNDRNIKPLKLIIMSATLRIADFLDNPVLFRRGRPPLVQIEGRQYPVTLHFSRQTQPDYVQQAFLKICKGHRRLPPGAMLVFLTGQDEIESLSKRLKEELAETCHATGRRLKVRMTANDAPLEAGDFDVFQDLDGNRSEKTKQGDLGFWRVEGDALGPAEDDDADEFDVIDQEKPSPKAKILPLYSQLPTQDQLRVFEPPLDETRLIILATNVAETSLTIPGIRYVFDCGRKKFKKYDYTTGIQSFEVGWISKASAAQRAGRAGRTGPGHCYRLYSSAVYESDFTEDDEPEIVRMPVEDVVLQLKSMNLQHIANFPFPTPPDRAILAKAERTLTHLGAIQKNGALTDLGRELSKYPISPRYAKMLSIGHQHECLPYTLALVTALAIPNLFLQQNHLRSSTPLEGPPARDSTEDVIVERQARQLQAYRQAQATLSIHSSTSDAIKALTALCAYGHAVDKSTFCKDMFLSTNAMREAASLFAQLTSIVHSLKSNLKTKATMNSLAKMQAPSMVQIAALQQFVAAAFIDQVAILASESPSASPDMGRRPSRAIDVPYLPLFPIHKLSSSTTELADASVYIHPSSLLADRSIKDLPTYIIYHHLQQAAPSSVGNPEQGKQPKIRMYPLTAVSGRQLTHLAYGTDLLEYGKPIGKIEELAHGQRRVCWVTPSLVNKSGKSLGWPLPAIKVKQVKASGGWEVDVVLA